MKFDNTQKKKTARVTKASGKSTSKFAAFKAQHLKKNKSTNADAEIAEEKVFDAGFFKVSSPVRTPHYHCEGKRYLLWIWCIKGRCGGVVDIILLLLKQIYIAQFSTAVDSMCFTEQNTSKQIDTKTLFKQRQDLLTNNYTDTLQLTKIQDENKLYPLIPESCIKKNWNF